MTPHAGRARSALRCHRGAPHRNPRPRPRQPLPRSHRRRAHDRGRNGAHARPRARAAPVLPPAPRLRRAHHRAHRLDPRTHAEARRAPAARNAAGADGLPRPIATLPPRPPPAHLRAGARRARVASESPRGFAATCKHRECRRIAAPLPDGGRGDGAPSHGRRAGRHCPTQAKRAPLSIAPYCGRQHDSPCKPDLTFGGGPLLPSASH